MGQVGRGISVLANASMALALSAHTPRVQLSAYTVSACWHSELGYNTPGRYLASAGTPVMYYYHWSASKANSWLCKLSLLKDHLVRHKLGFTNQA